MEANRQRWYCLAANKESSQVHREWCSGRGNGSLWNGSLSMSKIKATWHKAGAWRRPGEYQGCCDCGLIHRVEFRIRNGKIEQRAWRSDEDTKTARKRFKFTMH